MCDDDMDFKKLPLNESEAAEQRAIIIRADELAKVLGAPSARAMYLGLGGGRHVRSLVMDFEDAERLAARLQAHR